MERQLKVTQEALASTDEGREQALSALSSARDKLSETLAAQEAEAARER